MGAAVVTGYRVDYDPSAWLPIPDPAEAEGWPALVVAHYEAALGPLPEGLAGALAGFAAEAAHTRTDETDELFLFCAPGALPVVGVVGLQVTEVDGEVDLVASAAAETGGLVAPAVDDIVIPFWGAGRRAIAITEAADEAAQGARVTYAFERDGILLLATAVVDRSSHAAAILPFSEQLVAAVRLEH